MAGHTRWGDVAGPMTPEKRARIDAEKVEVLTEHLTEAIRERDHWQANHDEVVAKKRRLEKRYERLWDEYQKLLAATETP